MRPCFELTPREAIIGVFVKKIIYIKTRKLQQSFKQLPQTLALYQSENKTFYYHCANLCCLNLLSSEGSFIYYTITLLS